MARLRMALTVAGAVSLGAYEGGALAALMVAVQRMRGAVVIDTITGASAGAITAVLAARCLARGVDPVEAMVESWVTLPSLKRLFSKDWKSPLSGDVLAQSAEDLLGGGLKDGPLELRQGEPVAVSLTVVTLGGLQYRIHDVERNTPVDAVTHLDWVNYKLDIDTPLEQWRAAAQAALASGANAVGFPPKLLVRSPEDIEEMRRNGVRNPPSKKGTWYTDGGTINNEPFGRALDLIAEGRHPEEDDRLLLLVHPHPAKKPGESLWTDPTMQPRWTRTGLRAKKLQGTQSIYDDLRRLEKTNTRLREVQRLARKLEDTAVAVLDGADPAVAAELRSALKAALIESMAEQHGRRVTMHEAIGRAAPGPFEAPDTESTSLHDLLCAAINRAAGLAGKKPARVEIVSPALEPGEVPAEDVLAGEKLGHFFGFLDERLRRSDFLAGWDHMVTFLGTHLDEHGVVVPEEVMGELKRRRSALEADGWRRLRPEEATLKILSLMERARLGLLGVKFGRVVGMDIFKWDKGFPVGRGR